MALMSHPLEGVAFVVVHGMSHPLEGVAFVAVHGTHEPSIGRSCLQNYAVIVFIVTSGKCVHLEAQCRLPE